MLKHGICPNCDSRDIMANVHVIDRGHGNNTTHELTVGMYQNPNAILLKDLYQSALRAWICGRCGYTELFAQNPQELLAIYQRTGGS
jgi:ribosomal protein S27AE